MVVSCDKSRICRRKISEVNCSNLVLVKEKEKKVRPKFCLDLRGEENNMSRIQPKIASRQGHVIKVDFAVEKCMNY